MEETKNFRYSRVTNALALLFPIGAAWLFLAAYRQGGSFLYLVGIAAVPASLWEWFRSPNSFVFQNGVITARWVGGRQQSWQVADLTVPGATSRWFSLRGYVPVMTRKGSKVFKVSVRLERFADFVDLFEPGSKERREASDPNSWWNRNLL